MGRHRRRRPGRGQRPGPAHRHLARGRDRGPQGAAGTASSTATAGTASAPRCTRTRTCSTTAGPARARAWCPGMALAIEPMITMGSPRTVELADGWTVVTRDGSIAAHVEHTMALCDDGVWVLTAPDGGRARLGDLVTAASPRASTATADAGVRHAGRRRESASPHLADPPPRSTRLRLPDCAWTTARPRMDPRRPAWLRRDVGPTGAGADGGMLAGMDGRDEMPSARTSDRAGRLADRSAGRPVDDGPAVDAARVRRSRLQRALRRLAHVRPHGWQRRCVDRPACRSTAAGSGRRSWRAGRRVPDAGPSATSPPGGDRRRTARLAGRGLARRTCGVIAIVVTIWAVTSVLSHATCSTSGRLWVAGPWGAVAGGPARSPGWPRWSSAGVRPVAARDAAERASGPSGAPAGLPSRRPAIAGADGSRAERWRRRARRDGSMDHAA